MPSEGPPKRIDAKSLEEFFRQVDSGKLDKYIIEAREIEYGRRYAEIKRDVVDKIIRPTTPEELMDSAARSVDENILQDPNATDDEKRAVRTRLAEKSREELDRIPRMLRTEGPITKELRDWFKKQPQHFQAFLARKNK